ncbi:hypothetical protein HYH02_014476 [Chlamydomonas schloesseri]|uniref:NnrU domain-containing protein n=1 Tax=Chlamydomonas schloesseri TaxID=2026947 RepID=A0A835SWG5_9CHLO|nr:hypothetical protein HYH02_014476 [Chlamydomonas schloesseri]|eukprot:KAG2428085.1 hypothetical protein HYH02_014476 [Chlamydomonas schloesseri]
MLAARAPIGVSRCLNSRRHARISAPPVPGRLNFSHAVTLAKEATEQRASIACRAAQQDEAAPAPAPALVGEDSAAFDLAKQSPKSWALFVVLLSTVLAALYVVWIQPGTGLADDYLGALESLAGSSEATMALILLVFAIAHSGLAGLRPKGEELVGPRAYRVMFALVSLPLALVAIVFFINHRYDGVALWNVRDVPGVHELVWIINFISFWFLYPSTFNILEVAAVDKPKLHLWETGIMRISRHPQMVGQGLWCLAHTLWVGTSFMCVATAGLMAHHLFGCWHGDRRLKAKYGDAFEAVKSRTSVVPFAALLDGRQQPPEGWWWKEFARAPYLAVTALTIGAYFAHPLMQAASYSLKW